MFFFSYILIVIHNILQTIQFSVYTDLKTKHSKVLFPYGRHGPLFIEDMALFLLKAWPSFY